MLLHLRNNTLYNNRLSSCQTLQCGSGVMSGTLIHHVYKHHLTVAVAAAVAVLVVLVVQL
jgi:hypothetical protein